MSCEFSYKKNRNRNLRKTIYKKIYSEIHETKGYPQYTRISMKQKDILHSDNMGI